MEDVADVLEQEIRHKAPSETASQQKRAALFIELGVASPLDVHVTVQLEEIHFAVAIEHQRKIQRNIIYRDGIAFLGRIDFFLNSFQNRL